MMNPDSMVISDMALKKDKTFSPTMRNVRFTAQYSTISAMRKSGRRYEDAAASAQYLRVLPTSARAQITITSMTRMNFKLRRTIAALNKGGRTFCKVVSQCP